MSTKSGQLHSEVTSRGPASQTLEDPELSIVILTWNRRADVLRTLAVLEQMPCALRCEVIVVDNGSTDRTPAAISARFPNVRLVVLPENRGTSSFNHGFARARAPYILSLDDDSHPAGEWLDLVPGAFQRRLDAGIIACRVIEGQASDTITAGWGGRSTAFVACGALLRREVFARVGGYDERIFLYEHEKEYAFRVLAAGYAVYYEPNFVVVHRASHQNRSVSRRLSLGMEATMYRIVRYYPVRYLPLAVAFGVVYHLRWCLQCGHSVLRYCGALVKACWRGAWAGYRVRQPFPRLSRERIAAAWREDFRARSSWRRRLAALIPKGFFW